MTTRAHLSNFDIGDRFFLSPRSKVHAVGSNPNRWLLTGTHHVQSWCGKYSASPGFIPEDTELAVEDWCQLCKKRWLDNPWGKS